jgi:hypothetical protein
VRNARHLQSHVGKLSVRTIIIRSAIVVVVALIAWLLGARQLSLMLDRLVTVPLYALPVSPIAYSPDTLWIDKLSFNFTPAAQPIEVHVVCDAANRVTLTSGGQPFPMGICTRSPQYASEFDFTADPGDKVSLDVSRALISWPTPFEMNFMTGYTASRRRHLYYRLIWEKVSGAKLTMLWRFEQGFHQGDGWTSGMMIHAGTTGLIHLQISPPQAR